MTPTGAAGRVPPVAYLTSRYSAAKASRIQNRGVRGLPARVQGSGPLVPKARSSRFAPSRLSVQPRPHGIPQPRQQFRIKPGVALDPAVVAPGGMRERHQDRLTGRSAISRQRCTVSVRPARASAPRCQRWAYWPTRRTSSRSGSAAISRGRHSGAHSRRGGRSPPLASRPGKQKPMGTMAMRRGVVELVVGDAHPGPQPHAGGVGEWFSGGVDAGARRLAENADAGGGADAEDRARLVRQRRPRGGIAAQAAGADVGDECVEIAGRTAGVADRRAHTSTTSPSSASTIFGPCDLMAACQHRGVHVGQHDALCRDARQVAFKDFPARVEFDRAVEGVALGDEEIGAGADRDQCVDPLGIAGEGEDLAAGLEAQGVGGGAGGMGHFPGRHGHRPDGQRGAGMASRRTSAHSGAAPWSSRETGSRRRSWRAPRCPAGRRPPGGSDAWRRAGRAAATIRGRRNGRRGDAR